MVFKKIRERFDITEQDYMQSLGPEQVLAAFLNNNFDYLYELCSSGKSGSLFYYTKDKNYLIKQIPEREFVKFRSILKEYFGHIKSNPETLISRFFGLHQVVWKDSAQKENKRYLVIMNNVFKDFDVGVRFDLKGSQHGREELAPGQGIEDHIINNVKTALKDNDWREHVKQVTLDEAGFDNRSKF